MSCLRSKILWNARYLCLSVAVESDSDFQFLLLVVSWVRLVMYQSFSRAADVRMKLSSRIVCNAAHTAVKVRVSDVGTRSRKMYPFSATTPAVWYLKVALPELRDSRQLGKFSRTILAPRYRQIMEISLLCFVYSFESVPNLFYEYAR